VSMMNRFESICSDAEYNARFCIERGERVEDISEAVFSYLFNHLGHNPDLMNWAMDATSKIIGKISESKVVIKDIERDK